jgi:hypothetical protein
MKLALLAPALLLAACASAVHTPGHPVPKYSPKAPMMEQYGEWWLEPTTCTVRATATDFTLSTDGHVDSNGTISLRALFTMPLVKPPVAEVSELPVPVPVEGANRAYNILLAYDANNAAHMLKNDTYLIVQYQPLTQPLAMESSFATHGLMTALADLASYCRN